MRCSLLKSILAIAILLSTTSLMATDKPPRPISVTDIPASNTAELNAEQNAKITFRQTAQKADAAMKRARAEGGEWREIANLLMQSSVVSRTGDFQKATKIARQAQFMAEESYNAVIAARKQKAAAAAEEEKVAAAKKAVTEKKKATSAK